MINHRQGHGLQLADVERESLGVMTRSFITFLSDTLAYNSFTCISWVAVPQTTFISTVTVIYCGVWYTAGLPM